MVRYAPAALVAALLVATGFAFLHTESLKLETSPIRQTRVTKLFSPVCRCDTSKARIAFRLAKPDVVSVSIVDTSGSDVRQLAFERPAQRPGRVLWNGRDDDGVVVRDGAYRARVRLDLIEKTFLLPNLIRVDTKAPTAKVVSVRPRVFSPDGDRRADRVTVRYTVERAGAGDALRGRDPARRRRRAQARRASYGGTGWSTAGRFRPAVTRSQVRAVDQAGNLSTPVDAGHVRIRYVELTPTRYAATARQGRSACTSRPTPPACAGSSASGRGRPRAGLPRPRPRRARPLHPLGRRARAPGGRSRPRGRAVTRRRWIVAAAGRGAGARDRGRSCGMVVPRADDAEGGGGLLDRRVRAAEKPQAKPRPPKVVETVPWPTYGYDNQRTHLSPFEHRPPYRRLWMLRTRWYVEYPPVVGYGKVFVSQLKGVFYAVDAKTGEWRWRRKFDVLLGCLARPRGGARDRVVHPDAVHEGTERRAGARDRDAAEGRQDGVEAADLLESSPLVVGRRVYVGSWDHRVYALGLGTGKVLWSTRVDGEVDSSAAYCGRDRVRRRQQRHA